MPVDRVGGDDRSKDSEEHPGLLWALLAAPGAIQRTSGTPKLAPQTLVCSSFDPQRAPGARQFGDGPVKTGPSGVKLGALIAHIAMRRNETCLGRAGVVAAVVAQHVADRHANDDQAEPD